MLKLLGAIHQSQKRLRLLKKELDAFPKRWVAHQEKINDVLEQVFQSCREFERNAGDDQTMIYKTKRLFADKFRPYLRWGRYNRHVMDKPFGYHGDFFIMDEIYKNKPETTGIERCLDNYFLETGASIATRNRKEDFKAHVKEFLKQTPKPKVRVLDLASGPCRDVAELFRDLGGQSPGLEMDCLDHDPLAIEYAQKITGRPPQGMKINFIQQNAIRLALTQSIAGYLPKKYDLIFSAGFFDYLDAGIAVRLVANLKKILARNGLMIVSNYRDGWSNPSRHFMEWGGGWELIYRSEEEFLGIFFQAGFRGNELSLKFEPLKIMQYCFAKALETAPPVF